LAARGTQAQTLRHYEVTGRPDSDVVRRIAEQEPGQWVLVTMDLTILEDSPRFDWSRYAIAWVRVRDDLRGVVVEEAKIDIVHRYAHIIREQEPSDHHTYSANGHSRYPPSLTYMTRRRA
jgi:hypothetical protein